jgi:hypothetical protein
MSRSCESQGNNRPRRQRSRFSTNDRPRYERCQRLLNGRKPLGRKRGYATPDVRHSESDAGQMTRSPDRVCPNVLARCGSLVLRFRFSEPDAFAALSEESRGVRCEAERTKKILGRVLRKRLADGRGERPAFI